MFFIISSSFLIFTHISIIQAFGITLEETEKPNGYLDLVLSPFTKSFHFIKRMILRQPKSWKYQAKNAAVFAFQGAREYMEDRFFIDENFENTGVSLYAIFDGHGGDFCVKYVVNHLMNTLEKKIYKMKKGNIDENLKIYFQQNTINYKQFLIDEILNMEKSLLKKLQTLKNEAIEKILKPKIKKRILDLKQYTKNNGDIDDDKLLAEKKFELEELYGSDYQSGTTVLIALIDDEQLYIANVGDSRAVMGHRDGSATRLTNDHKPSEPKERKRMRYDANGGYVDAAQDEYGIWRIDGLSVSRTLGDLDVKSLGHVTADPDTFHFDLSKDQSKFFIIASDGLWDAIEDDDAAKFIDANLDQELYGAKSITLKAQKDGMTLKSIEADNITVLVVKTKTTESPNSQF